MGLTILCEVHTEAEDSIFITDTENVFFVKYEARPKKQLSFAHRT